jgi:hypothetical protein
MPFDMLTDSQQKSKSINSSENDENDSELELEIAAENSLGSFNRVVQNVDSAPLVEDLEPLNGADTESIFSSFAENGETAEEEAVNVDQAEITAFSTLSKDEKVTGAFVDLPMDIPSSDLIDAETYSIHGSSDESSKLNSEEKTAANSLSSSNILSEDTTDVETGTVETSPLIPDWAKRTENPAFYQNLDIPTFLRRLGSTRPRQ